MERLGLIPTVDLNDATAKALIVPPAGYVQLVIDSTNASKLTSVNSSGTEVVFATV